MSRPKVVVVLLALGVLSSFAYDIVASNGVEARIGGIIEKIWMEWFLFAVALPFRLFTYAALFFSFLILVGLLKNRRKRLLHLWMAWLGNGFIVLVALWGWLATSETIGLGVSVKRMSPETMAHFAPDNTLAAIALGPELAKSYTWFSAISLELLAFIVATTVVATVLWWASNLRASAWAVLAPVSSVPVLILYMQFAPWSLNIDFDIFIGDALLGTTLLSVMFFPMTLLFGGATGYSVWISLIAAINLFFIWSWSEELTEER